MPIAAEQDTAGPMGRTVTDVAILLGGMTGFDPLDPATTACPAITDYRRYLNPNGLRGARIGIPRTGFYNNRTPEQLAVAEEAIGVLRAQGATIVDPAEIPTALTGELQAWGVCASLAQGKGLDASCSVVLKYGFKRDFNAYVATLGRRAPVGSLAELIAFNDANAGRNAIKYGQQRLLISEEMDLVADAPRLAADRARDLDINQVRGIDAAIDANRLDALLFPGPTGAGIAARPGYPSVIVPAGFIPNLPAAGQPPYPGTFQPEPQPWGVMFTGKACTEDRLIELAYAYEQASQKRVPPVATPSLH
jgi:amidase